MTMNSKNYVNLPLDPNIANRESCFPRCLWTVDENEQITLFLQHNISFYKTINHAFFHLSVEGKILVDALIVVTL